MAVAEKVPLLDLDVLGGDPSGRLEAWSDMVRPLCDMAPLNWHGVEGLIHCRCWLLDRVIVADTALAPHVMERRPIHLKKYGKAYVVIRLHVAGETSSEVGADAYTTQPGDLNIVDFTEMYSGISTRTRVLAIMIPHDAIGFDPARHPAHIHISPRGPHGAHLAATFLRLARSLTGMTLQQANAEVLRFRILLSDFLERVVAFGNVEPDLTVIRRREMRAVVEKSLQSSGLSAKMLADEFEISRATVYRDLDSLGGLQHYVTRRRVEEACKELVFGPNQRGVVGGAAERWRFNSTAHFSREFRRHFGFSPSRVIDSALFRMTPDDPRVMGQQTKTGVPPWLVNL